MNNASITATAGGAFAIYTLTSISAMADEITNRELVEAFGEAVRLSGYVCPYTNMAWNKGYGPQGVIIKIFCGPAPGKVNTALIYRGILTDDDRLIVTPWE